MTTADVVPNGVVHEVGDETFDQYGVPVQRCGAGGGLDTQPEAFGFAAWARYYALADLR